MMKIDESSINHNALILIDFAIKDSFDEEHADEFLMSTFNYIKGVCDMVNAMKDVLKC